MKELVSTYYGEKFLEPKTFLHLFPWGFGGWHYNCPMMFESDIKMKLYDVQGWWAHNSAYMCFKYDEMVKLRLRGYNSRRVVRVSDLSEDSTAAKKYLMQKNPLINTQFMEQRYHDQFLVASNTGSHFL